MTDPSDQKPKTIGDIALEWWERVTPVTRTNGRRSGDAGAFARLRRADLNGAMMEEWTSELFRSLRPVAKVHPKTLFERAALIAAVLAHVRDDDGAKRVAEAAGEKRNSDQRVLHPLRLRRLFAARNPPDCLIAFRRLVALLGKKVNVADLAESLFDWPDEMAGDRRRTRWAFDYYGAGSTAPNGDQDQAAA